MSVIDYPNITGKCSKGVASFDDFTDFPAVGMEGVLYIDEGNADLYLWDGSIYEMQGGGGGSVTWDDITGALTPVSFWSQMPAFPALLNYNVIECDHWAGTPQPLTAYGAGNNAAYAPANADNSATGANAAGKAIGVTQLQTGGDTDGKIYLGSGLPNSNGASIFFGSHEQHFGVRQSSENPSDSTDTYTQYIGFMDIFTATPNNGLFFRYSHGVNSGKWEYCQASAGTVIAADTGVTAKAFNPSAVDSHMVFEISVNRAGTRADFYIEGTLVGSITTGITTSVIMVVGTNIIKSAGTTNRRFFVDAFYYATERLSAR